jgi:hypothetical protein
MEDTPDVRRREGTEGEVVSVLIVKNACLMPNGFG